MTYYLGTYKTALKQKKEDSKHKVLAVVTSMWKIQGLNR